MRLDVRRIEREPALELRARLVVAAEARQHDAVVVVRPAVARVDAKRLRVVARGAFEVAAQGERRSQVEVRERVVRGHGERVPPERLARAPGRDLAMAQQGERAEASGRGSGDRPAPARPRARRLPKPEGQRDEDPMCGT